MEVSETTSVAELLKFHKLELARVAVERNGEIVSRKDFYRTILAAHDRLEIVTLVGGG